MQKSPNIIIQNAYLDYKSHILFEHLNLTIPAGKITCLLGPSGVGKSTLLRIIANLIPLGNSQEQHFSGDISCDNGLPLKDQITYLGQQDSLLPWLTAMDNVLLGSRLRGNMTQETQHKAKTLFTELNLNHIEQQFPHQLSGGMCQRVALIRTLVEDKPIALMDEPFSAVDAITRYQLQTLAVNYLKNRTVLLVTHDPLEALRMADHLYILAGQPADIQSTISLETQTPRELNDPDLLHYQTLLFNLLTTAKESSL